MTLDEADRMVAVLAAAYPHTSLGGETVALYAFAFADVTAAEGAAIVGLWTATEPRWPSVSQLRALIAKRRGEAAPDVDQAWEEVRRSFGSAREPAWSHPAIGEAVQSIGYREIGQGEPDVVRGQFARHYQATKLRAVGASVARFGERVSAAIVGERGAQPLFPGPRPALKGGG